MKKLQQIFSVATVVAMTLTGCSQVDDFATNSDLTNNESNAVQFGTYMGRTKATRAGAEGTITTAQLLAQKNGFGVFGYYTGASTYNEVQYDNGSNTTANYQDQAANFMFNQQITGTDATTPVWSYSPIKYWPNEVQNGAVDDQTDPATSTNAYGGKLSFFAYAPYTAFPVTPTTDGIVAINGATTLASANAVTGDPTVTYTIPTDLNADNTGGAFVDLLWGTLNGTSVNVLGTAQSGVEGTKTTSSANPIRPTTGTYAANVLDDYFTNADLTKQKTEGTVGFKFIHALSKIGGGSEGTSPTTGFLVQLDIDNNGNENGGTREKYDANSDSDTDDDDDLWRTIVTVKSITITNDVNGSSTINDTEVGIGGTRTLNLATGCWSDDEVNSVYSQTIGTADGTNTYNAVLNTKIAEIYDNSPTTWLAHLTAANYFKNSNAKDNTSTHPGVTETAQSVYNNANQSPIILFPGTTPKFKITIDYIVRTHDPNLSAGYSEVEQVITKTITFGEAVKMNKHYSILMRLGLTGVKFNATVSTWDLADGDNDGTSGEADDAEQVYLPINVQ